MEELSEKTKQEDLRRGIYHVVKPYIKMHNDAVSCSWEILHYLHSQGVVKIV